MDHEDRKRRYATVRVFRLGEEPPDDLTEVTTVAERLAMVETLSHEAWTLAGFGPPDVDRSQMPIAVVELGSASAGDRIR